MSKASFLEPRVLNFQFSYFRSGTGMTMRTGICRNKYREILNSAKSGPCTGPFTFTRMFEPRHNIRSNVRADIPKYVSWLKHSRESNRPAPGPIVMLEIDKIRKYKIDLHFI